MATEAQFRSCVRKDSTPCSRRRRAAEAPRTSRFSPRRSHSSGWSSRTTATSGCSPRGDATLDFQHAPCCCCVQEQRRSTRFCRRFGRPVCCRKASQLDDLPSPLSARGVRRFAFEAPETRFGLATARLRTGAACRAHAEPASSEPSPPSLLPEPRPLRSCSRRTARSAASSACGARTSIRSKARPRDSSPPRTSPSTTRASG